MDGIEETRTRIRLKQTREKNKKGYAMYNTTMTL